MCAWLPIPFYLIICSSSTFAPLLTHLHRSEHPFCDTTPSTSTHRQATTPALRHWSGLDKAGCREASYYTVLRVSPGICSKRSTERQHGAPDKLYGSLSRRENVDRTACKLLPLHKHKAAIRANLLAQCASETS
jgi:hypothetical protein